MASTSVESHGDASFVVDILLQDLHTLLTEARKKHELLKKGAESVIVLVRNVQTNSPPEILHGSLVNKSMEIIHPYLIGLSTKNPKIVQIGLQSIQRMLQYRILHPTAAPALVDQLWDLAEAECEELRVLQTITPLVNADLLVSGSTLAKCILVAIKLNFSKDSSVINAASASVRQLFSCVFERVVQEDGINNLPVLTFNPTRESSYCESYGSENSAEMALKMNTCAADGYLLLKDLMSLIRRESTFWLDGVKRFTVTLALELLESVVKGYPSVFFRHAEYAAVLRDLIFPQVMHVMTGEKMLKSKEVVSVEKPPFPLQMRCFRIGLVLTKNYYEIIGCECSTFIEIIVRLLASKKAEWQTAAALEVIHKLVGQPELLRYLAQNDCTINELSIIQVIIESVAGYSNFTIKKALNDDPMEAVDQQQPGFLCGETFLPLHDNVTAKKWILLDWLEKHEAGGVPEGYTLSLAYAILCDFTNSMFAIVEELHSPTGNGSKKENGNDKNTQISAHIFHNVYLSLTSGMVHLLIVGVDDSITESLLNCISTMVMIACKTRVVEAVDSIFRILCRLALPYEYFFNHISEQSTKCVCVLNNNPYSTKSRSIFCLDHLCVAISKLSQVVAVSSGCPTNNDPNPKSYSLIAKNMYVARTLLSAISANGHNLESTWDMILTTLQHLTWLLGMKPLPNGGFKTSYDSSDTTATSAGNILTTAVTNELPEFQNMMAKLFDSMYILDDVVLHHVIAALCKLSSEQMSIAQKAQRGPSYFAVSKLAQLGVVNQFRIEVFWRPLTAHLIDISNHFDNKLREFGSLSLNHLITSSFKFLMDEMQLVKEKPDTATPKQTPEQFLKRQAMIMNAVVQLSDVPYPDVRERQLNCVTYVFQCGSGYLYPSNWEHVVNVIHRIPLDPENNEHLLDLAYNTCSQICTEFLDALPFDCLLLVLHAVSSFGQQTKVVNISLNSIGLLWQISDRVGMIKTEFQEAEFQEFWFVLFDCMSKLCLDSRPPLRKSAGDTFLQTIACHGDVISPDIWHSILYSILFPLSNNVLAISKDASTESSKEMLMHHSRDTPAKQWAETAVRNVSGLVRIFNSQRAKISHQDDYFETWKNVLLIMESASCSNNPEICLAGLNAFLELQLGKVTSDSTDNIFISKTKRSRRLSSREQTPSDRAGSLDSTSVNGDDQKENDQLFVLPEMDDRFYLESFETCYRIGNALTCYRSLDANMSTPRFLPSSYYFTTYLKSFLILFHRVKQIIDINYFQHDKFLSVLRNIVAAPRSSDQVPFSMNNGVELSSTHEAALETIKVIIKENLKKNSPYRVLIPDTFKLLFEFCGYAVRPPATDFVVTQGKHSFAAGNYNLVPFAEICLKTAIDAYRKCFSWANVVNAKVFSGFIKALREPLVLRYGLPDSGIWINASIAFNEVSRLGFSIVRENIQGYDDIWLPYSDTVNRFIFCKNRGQPFNADERRRYEFHDCQMVETIRSQILTHANKFPWDFMQRIIDILNNASVITLDNADIMALDLCEQRTDLCRASFEALLSLSNTQVPEHFIFCSTSGEDSPRLKEAKSLGAYAISLLLLRCQQVLNDYARDERNSGMLPLSASRVYELISVLRAIATLIEGLVKHSKEVIDSLYDRLVDLYPVLVQMIPCSAGNSDVQISLMIALNSYKILLTI